MPNSWANNPLKQEHAVEDICNSTTVISANACYANPAKILYYHSAFVCRLELLPLARQWLPLSVSVCACWWAHIINLAGTECIHATCIAYCVAHSLSLSPFFSLSFLLCSSSFLSFLPSCCDPAATWRVSHCEDFYCRPFFTLSSNWIMHRRIKIPSLKVPSMDYNAEANTFSTCGGNLMYSVTYSNEVKLKLPIYLLGQVAHIDLMVPLYT